jgi:Fe2+ transport system protein FeoA
MPVSGRSRQYAPFIITITQQERYPALIPADITAMHTIELIGSYIARHVESGLTVDLTSRRNCRTTKGPISPLCRKLVDLGYDPEGKVHVIRKALDRDGHIPVFQRDRALETWADVDAVESETRTVEVQKYRPFPAAVETIQKGQRLSAT